MNVQPHRADEQAAPQPSLPRVAWLVVWPTEEHGKASKWSPRHDPAPDRMNGDSTDTQKAHTSVGIVNQAKRTGM